MIRFADIVKLLNEKKSLSSFVRNDKNPPYLRFPRPRWMRAYTQIFRRCFALSSPFVLIAKVDSDDTSSQIATTSRLVLSRPTSRTQRFSFFLRDILLIPSIFSCFYRGIAVPSSRTKKSIAPNRSKTRFRSNHRRYGRERFEGSRFIRLPYRDVRLKMVKLRTGFLSTAKRNWKPSHGFATLQFAAGARLD